MMKIAIDLGGTHVRTGLIQGDRLTEIRTSPCPSQLSCEESIHYLADTARELIQGPIQGIGIGVPSVVDAGQGIVYNATNIPAWKEVHLKKELESLFGVPVQVNNDANCFAWGEHLFGTGKPFRNLVGITLGTGTGAGVIIDGALYNGSNTGAGEIGSLSYLDRDFEYYCSSSYFTHFCRTTGKEAFRRATAGDTEALKQWDTFGTHLGQLVKAVLFTYDPEAIVWGGGLSAAYPFFEASMWKAVQDFPYQETVKKLHILVSQTPYVSLLGASALIR